MNIHNICSAILTENFQKQYLLKTLTFLYISTQCQIEV